MIRRAGHQQHSHGRSFGRQLSREIDTIQPWHVDVRQEQINVPLVLGREVPRFYAIAGDQQMVGIPLQDSGEELAYHFLIIGDQNNN